jgi:hypothetical protein
MPISLLRLLLLIFAILTILTATLLDGIMMRYIVRPMLRFAEQRAGGRPVEYPGPMRFLLERTWVRRSYHLLFAIVLLALWWYLGTSAGTAAFARSQQLR